jgi:hypothetical protein
MRITGRQLRQIIKEEVARMMNEAAVTTPTQMIEAVTQIEDAINSEIGTNFGAAGSVFSDVLNGKKNPRADAVRAVFNDLGDTSFKAVLNIAVAAVKSVCVANGRNDIQVGTERVMMGILVTVNGETLSGDIGDVAQDLGRYVRDNMR